MAFILGLTGPVSFDQAAVILEDGRIVAAVEEERFSGIKHHRFGPPLSSIRYCLEHAGISAGDLDSVAVGWGSPPYWASCLARLLIRHPYALPCAPAYAADLGRRYRGDFVGGYRGKVGYHRHHIAHMASAYLTSGFRRANIISIDECGESEATVIGFGDGGEVEVMDSFDCFNSLGRLYRLYTEYLGFSGYGDEYKVMGLAAYGRPLQDFGRLLRVTRDGYSLQTRHYYIAQLRNATRRLESAFRSHDAGVDLECYLGQGRARKPGDTIEDRHRDIAATAQAIYEKALIHLAKLIHSRTGCQDFALAGGCGLNCSANGKLMQQDFVERLYVPPAASDAGSALGAALLEAAKRGEVNNRLRDAGLGPSYGEETIRAELEGLDYGRPDDIGGAVAELLADGKIVGWFQGRMEFGPRALGQRSILSSPADLVNRDRVNRLKGRETWRPLAPSLLEESVADYFEGGVGNDFMTVALPVNSGRRGEIPAVVHADGTARYQTVGKDRGEYRGLLESFNRRTGIPVLLNTSFNGRGQPIVRSPGDALKTFKRIGLDALAIGDYLLE
jgi:carbamoyltransferase